jgi:ribA/ribD-fused uncharacterized protein
MAEANNSGEKPSSDRYLFFFGSSGRQGWLSQWYLTRFVVSSTSFEYLRGEQNRWWTFPDEDVSFSSAEQYMMFCKAFYFGDFSAGMAVLKTHSTYDIRQIGRQVTAFSESKWIKVREEIVEAGNYAKFTQNPELQTALLETGEIILVEANQWDRIWGIGYSADKAMADCGDWGLNLLGKSLMRVRERINAAKLQATGDSSTATTSVALRATSEENLDEWVDEESYEERTRNGLYYPPDYFKEYRRVYGNQR